MPSKTSDGTKTYFSVPYSLIPVYLVLILQFVGVVWYTSGLYSTVNYQTKAIQDLQGEVKKLVEDGLANKFTAYDAQREFAKRDANLQAHIDSANDDFKKYDQQMEDVRLRIREIEVKLKLK